MFCFYLLFMKFDFSVLHHDIALNNLSVTEV